MFRLAWIWAIFQRDQAFDRLECDFVDASNKFYSNLLQNLRKNLATFNLVQFAFLFPLQNFHNIVLLAFDHFTFHSFTLFFLENLNEMQESSKK